MITTDVIASLVGKAWSLAFTPVNIMAGFKKSGAYPLNPGVIDDRQVAPSLAVNPSCKKKSVSDEKGSESTETCSTGSGVSSFSPEQEALFRRRYEEKFDLPDPEYQKWLAINQPEDVKSSGSMVTHISGSRSVQSSGTSSDVLSEVLKLPEPQPPKRKRKAGFNTGKAVSITNDSFVSDLKDKEEEKKAREEEKKAKQIEKQRKKEEREKKRAKAEKRKSRKKIRNEKQIEELQKANKRQERMD